ncbi:MAG: response regulator transcription factor [Deltaproteobacteria bacterium]|nr:response regulator transcription factor [Deltaproteobacteria bacterium]TLN03060.1 MAG: response regulator transcription factor [bacterium]
MNILINLGSSLLGEALKEALGREQEDYQLRTIADFSQRKTFCPDFIIADCHSLRKGMPLAEPAVKVILLDYGLGEDEITSLLLTHKIDGVLSTHSDLSHFKKAVQAINDGQVWLDNRKVKALIQHAESMRSTGQDLSLSKKEREIVILISQGLMNREIADKLCISEQTVKTHISRIFRKVNVSRRSQLVPLALKLMVVEAP